jgi:hypothetical protein
VRGATVAPAAAGFAAVVVYLAVLVWVHPGLAGDASVIGCSFGAVLGILVASDLFGGGR